MEPTTTSTPPIDLTGRKVLIVDDDRLNIRILGGILKAEGYALADADSGEKALEVYAAFRPHLVLLDVMMPGIDGFETCRRLRKAHGEKCAPIIFIILQPFRRLIQNPNGIVFVTGPTGSGKTTTLYAALHEINTPALNITTIEDPIEIQLAGVTQSQVNTNIDLKFATILRALMRQDP